MRIEDIDPPREVPGSIRQILRALEALGLTWDGAVLYQSERTDAYRDAIQALLADGHAYWCTCSRREILQHPINRGRQPGQAAVYPGTCRGRYATPPREAAVRLRVTEPGVIEFDDLFQGPQSCNLAATSGDFVLQRRDGLFAYQLAVTLDDQFQGITRVVRGCDLMDSTPRQIWLRHCFDFPLPGFAHMPVVVNADGAKLSKQTGAEPLDMRRAGHVIYRALAFLRQSPPADLDGAPPGEILAWARERWDPELFRGRRAAAAPESATH